MRIASFTVIIYTLLDGTLVAAIGAALSSEIGTTVKQRLMEIIGSFM